MSIKVFPYEPVWNYLLLLKENTSIQSSVRIIFIKQNQKQKQKQLLNQDQKKKEKKEFI